MKYLIHHADLTCGGYGDRLVGLVACAAIAEATGRRLLIHWTEPDFSRQVSYGDYDYRAAHLDPAPAIDGVGDERTRVVSLIDCQPYSPIPALVERYHEYRRLFAEGDLAEAWPEPYVVIKLNSMYDIFLHPEGYHQRFLALMRSIYTEYLRPVTRITTVVDQFPSGMVGFQVRCGDIPPDKVDPNEVRYFTEQLIAHLRDRTGDRKGDQETVFLTADNSTIYDYVRQAHPELRLVVNDNGSVHKHICYTDYDPDSDVGVKDKLFQDHLILAKCRVIYNFGFVSNLALTAGLTGGVPVYHFQDGQFNRLYHKLEYSPDGRAWYNF